MIHVTCHNLAISPEDLWAQIVKWVPHNLEWIKSISIDFLARKKTYLMSYLKNMIHRKYKVDEVGLVIIAKMCDVHIAVLMKRKIWTTQLQTDINLCDIILAYVGHLQF